MRQFLFLSSVLALVAAMSVNACTGPTTGNNDDDDSSPTFTFSTPTPTAPLCNPSPCDDPGAASFDGAFVVADDGDGTFTATGMMAFDLYEYDGVNLGSQALCRQEWQFVADFETLDNSGNNFGVTGCDENGANCTQVCPMDDPTEAVNPTGTCAGHLSGFVIDPATYVTDCSFLNPIDWFHPEAGPNILLNEQWLFSFPVESAIPTGATDPASWGAWETLITEAGSPFETWNTHAQIGFVNVNRDADGLPTSWSENGFLFGVSATDPAVDGDNDGNMDMPNAEMLGNHELLNLFVLVFGAG